MMNFKHNYKIIEEKKKIGRELYILLFYLHFYKYFESASEKLYPLNSDLTFNIYLHLIVIVLKIKI